jgi:hypothetical protein
MKISPQATKAHMVVGALLVLLSLGAFIATLFIHQDIVTFLVFFFGVWGGVEIGRYLEFLLGQKNG